MSLSTSPAAWCVHAGHPHVHDDDVAPARGRARRAHPRTAGEEHLPSWRCGRSASRRLSRTCCWSSTKRIRVMPRQVDRPARRARAGDHAQGLAHLAVRDVLEALEQRAGHLVATRDEQRPAAMADVLGEGHPHPQRLDAHVDGVLDLAPEPQGARVVVSSCGSYAPSRPAIVASAAGRAAPRDSSSSWSLTMRSMRPPSDGPRSSSASKRPRDVLEDLQHALHARDVADDPLGRARHAGDHLLLLARERRARVELLGGRVGEGDGAELQQQRGDLDLPGVGHPDLLGEQAHARLQARRRGRRRPGW